MKTIELIETVCCICGTTFSLDETLNSLRKEDGKEFYCPNGHSQKWSKSRASIIEELKKEIQDLKDKLEASQFEVRQLKCASLNKTNDGFLKRVFNK